MLCCPNQKLGYRLRCKSANCSMNWKSQQNTLMKILSSKVSFNRKKLLTCKRKHSNVWYFTCMERSRLRWTRKRYCVQICVLLSLQNYWLSLIKVLTAVWNSTEIHWWKTYPWKISFHQKEMVGLKKLNVYLNMFKIYFCNAEFIQIVYCPFKSNSIQSLKIRGWRGGGGMITAGNI